MTYTYSPEVMQRICTEIEAHGLLAPDVLPAPGQEIRLSDVDKPDDDDGFLRIEDENCVFLANFKRGDKIQRVLLDGSSWSASTDMQRRHAKHFSKYAKGLRESDYRLAAGDCRQIWEQAEVALADHSYLQRKGIGSWASYLRCLRTIPAINARWDRFLALQLPVLVVPGYGPDGKIQTLQFVDVAGEKLYQVRGKRAGACMCLGNPEAPLVVVGEGLATVATVAMSVACYAFVAFDSGNLAAVAQFARSRFPHAAITICADDDRDDRVDSHGRPIPNAGKLAGIEAAHAAGARLALPDFDGLARGPRDTDFNDLAVLVGHQGLEAVRRQIEAAGDPPAMPLKQKSNGRTPQESFNVPPGQPQLNWFDPAGPRLTWQEIEAAAPTGTIRMEECWHVAPANKIYYRPTGAMLAIETFDRMLGKKGEKPSAWLARHQNVTQVIWAPGEPQLVPNRHLLDGGWVDHEGALCLNSYKPPLPAKIVRTPRGIRLWSDHIERLWPNEVDHIVRWLAWPTQHPDVKINHALLVGGPQGVGKDSALEPLKYAVGPWNWRETSPREIVQSQFNPYIKSVVLRINEVRDLGTESDRFKFYEQLKTLCAAPPDVLTMNDKHEKAVAVLNVMAVIQTTNHKAGGVYLPSDDRRHFVAWSDEVKEAFNEAYWNAIHQFYREGGLDEVANYLRGLDLSKFNPKAPPPRTPAFWEMVEANVPDETVQIEEIVAILGRPSILAVEWLRIAAQKLDNQALMKWSEDPKNARAIPHRLQEAGYVLLPNPDDARGRWRMGNIRTKLYARSDQPRAAALELMRSGMEKFMQDLFKRIDAARKERAGQVGQVGQVEAPEAGGGPSIFGGARAPYNFP